MKLKRILIMASAAAASSGLLATVLTSCSKSKIDDDLKIDLNDSGLFVKTKDFRKALTNALASSKTWATFKTALADELVYQWYVDRASTSKDSKDKNNRFRDNLDEWNYQIDEDYKDKVDEYKSKYGSNHKFYLQNELLSAHGGTEESYKHEQLVAKVKADFVSNVFDKSYFGLAKASKPSNEGEAQYPHIFTDIESSIDLDDLKNPESWSRLGFYAKANPSFPVNKLENTNLLAKDPDGDYAIIQNFVFNRWFKTEKPFFSAAALFKYSKPAKSEQKMSNIYNVNAATVPDDPNETFPFFGGMTDSSNGLTGTRAFWQWYKKLLNGTFIYDGKYKDGSVDKYNGSISIPTEVTEDSQTLLLCYGNQMIGGASNSLYIPYAISAASLYNQMLSVTGEEVAVKNKLTQTYLDGIMLQETEEPLYEDTAIIFKLFFYPTLPTGDNVIKSYIDLSTMYDSQETTGYHSKLFKKNADYTYLYGDTTNPDNLQPGVQFITNNVQINLTPNEVGAPAQPWIFELNEAGMHAQTIDCYSYVSAPTAVADKQKALKEAVMFRLMQKEKSLPGSDIISGSVLGKDGALKTYFNDNFADIILEMACEKTTENNIFRNISSYKTLLGQDDQDKQFLFNTWKNEQLGGTSWDVLCNYIKLTREYDRIKKNHDAVVTANDKIYAYRTSQITNSADNKGKKIYENGLLAPLAIPYIDYAGFNTTHHYSGVVSAITNGEMLLSDATFDSLDNKLADIAAIYPNILKDVAVNASNSGFSLQVAKAKEATSNRAWFASPIVDKMMYGYMGDKTLANEIKKDAYVSYVEKTTEKMPGVLTTADVQHAKASAYMAPKLFSDGKNFASYAVYDKNVPFDFFKTILGDPQASTQELKDGEYKLYLANDKTINGEFSDLQLNEELFNATVNYLAKDNFKNYYKELNRKIGDDIFAFTGYLSKYSTTDNWISKDKGRDPTKSTVDSTQPGGSPFDEFKWDGNVGNIFDEYGYGGYRGDPSSIDILKKNRRIDYDQYWNILDKTIGIYSGLTLNGFLGLQTSASNQLDDSSKLKTAVVDKFAISTENSPKLGGTGKWAQNSGALFQWAGTGTYNEETGKVVPYTFNDVKYKPEGGTEQTIQASDFGADAIKPALKLAKRIAESSTVDDLKKLAKAINDKYMGGSVFEDIAKNNYTIDWTDQLNQIKWMMLSSEKGLLKQTDGVYDFAKAFQRVTNVEVHGEIASPYCFENDKEGYKLIMTELNKSDVLEHTIHPTFDTASQKWTMVPGSGITEEEFWFIFFKLASDTTIQQSATADVVKTIYGDNKLEVYDAQLYNQFDAVWIKDWKKKPIGE